MHSQTQRGNPSDAVMQSVIQPEKVQVLLNTHAVLLGSVEVILVELYEI